MRNIKISFTNGETLDLMCYSINKKLSNDTTLVFDWNNLMPIGEDDPDRIFVSRQNVNYITCDTNTKGE